MTHRHLPTSRGSRRSALMLVSFLLAALIASVGLWALSGNATSTRNSPPKGALTVSASQTPVTPPADLGQDAAVRRQLEQLRAMPAPSPDPAQRDRIPDEARSHPDLYAAGFVTALLTQDYRTPRRQFLAWVDAEAATTTEPLVVGLVPVELRDRLAVYSVTEQSDGPGTSPVPSAAEWARLAALGGYTTVADVRVSEPLAWSNAVDAGRVTDPGVTARQVTATITLHTTAAGRESATRSSVSVTADFEGPPSRTSWGFVNVVLYTSLRQGTS